MQEGENCCLSREDEMIIENIVQGLAWGYRVHRQNWQEGRVDHYLEQMLLGE